MAWVDRISEVGNQASEGQAAGAGFTAGSLAGKGARGGTKGTGNNELMEVGRMAVGDITYLGHRLPIGSSFAKGPINLQTTASSKSILRTVLHASYSHEFLCFLIDIVSNGSFFPCINYEFYKLVTLT